LPATTSRAPGGPTNIYSHTLAGMWAPATRGVPYLVYAPDSDGSAVDVIDPATNQVIRTIQAGSTVQHVVPSWDLRTLYATNDEGNSLTPIDPRTGNRAGPDIPVPDPYNLYFTPDGKHAIVVEEARHILSFRDPHTFALQHDVPVDCSGVDHLDFSADGSYLIASCEFSGQLVRVDLNALNVTGYLNVGGMPQDVKLSPDGTIFYIANMNRGGVSLIDAATFREIGFLPTGNDAHGLYVSRNTKDLYVTNRRAGSISVIDFATRSVVATWSLPGMTPDMGNLSPDGTVLWLGGRYTGDVYAISTIDGHVIASIPAGNAPHGVCVWPQPGRYSTGHTGVMR
jgi:YVTN family beta-propeller protein